MKNTGGVFETLHPRCHHPLYLAMCRDNMTSFGLVLGVSARVGAGDELLGKILALKAQICVKFIDFISHISNGLLNYWVNLTVPFANL